MQFRVFAGPRYLPATDASNFPYYSSLPALGATWDPDYETAVLTTLTSGTTSLVTTNNSALYNNFPTSGGLWLGPNGANQGWEHVTYTGRSTNTFSGLGRESTSYREHNGVHNAGAEVRFWYPLDGDNGEFNFIDQLMPDFEARFWRMEMAGFALPHSLLRMDHMIAVVNRVGASGDWKFYALGISDSGKIRDSFERRGEWLLYASSPHGLCERSTVNGIHVGDLNVAPFGQADGSVPLGSAFKELISEDYSAAAPDFSPQSAIDDDPDTLYISDYMVGTEIELDSEWIGPTQLFLYPHPGRGPAYKWVELTNFSTVAANLHVYDPDTETDYALDITDIEPEEDYWVVLSDDPVTFRREYPASVPFVADVVELSDLSLGSSFLKHCKPEGGAMAIAEMSGKTHIIMWGDVDVEEVMDFWDLDPDQWIGDAIPAPGPGQTIAFKHDYEMGVDEDSRNKWEIRDYATPGYIPRHDNAENSWLAVYLPGLGLVLRDDIDDADTTIYLVDGAGEPSTEGLPNSGTIQIGADQITYSGKAADSLTGCSVNDDHNAGDLIYVVENGIATDGFPIEFIRLKRSGGDIYPEDYYVRWSRVLARFPDVGDHEEDYISPYGDNHNVTAGSTAEQEIVLDDHGDATVRLRTILIEFRKMTEEPACGRLNELQAIVDTSYFTSDRYVAAPADAGQVISKLFIAAGIPAGAINYASATVDIERTLRTARDVAWKTICDFADMCGLFINVGRNAEILITDNSFYSTAVGSYTPDHSWDEDDVVTVEKVSRAGRGVGQVRIEWEIHDGTGGGTAVYPATVGARGGLEDIGPYFFADEAAATLAARKRYWLAEAPDHVIVELVDIDVSIEPGQIFSLSWQFPNETSPMERLYIVAGVDMRIAQEEAVQVVTGLQIDREVQW